MKIIISESKLIDGFQKLTDKFFNDISRLCNDIEDDGDYCDDYESITDIKVISTQVIDGRYVIFIDIYSDALRYSDYDNITYEIDYRFGRFLGRTNVKVIHNSTILNKEHNW
jgi:hypothetical protein